MSKEFKNIDAVFSQEVEGKVEAVFSVFNTIDTDGDVVLPNSIKSGYGEKGVAMVWGHDWKDVIGRGEITQDNDKAVFKGEFIMDTERGREAYNTVKAMGDLQQWSFGYEVVDSEPGKFAKDGSEVDVRYLKELKVWEVSPVLVGANQETYTMAIKENKQEEETKEETGKKFTEEIEEALTALISVTQRAKELTALRLQKDKRLSEAAYDSISELQSEIQDIYDDLDTLLNVAAPEQIDIPDEEEVTDTIKKTIEILTNLQTVDI